MHSERFTGTPWLYEHAAIALAEEAHFEAKGRETTHHSVS